MSWEAGVFLLLAITLVGGMVWYERSKPSAQVVALVAALAALAVVGRIAFSPIPNVVPTTDITLITGFSLGGPPGFAVGALAALVSNFWLGQGPWTPWQMAGWGMVGLLGAALAKLTGRRLGRVGLAVACGLAGFGYGALLDFSLMVTYGGEQSLERFLALSARGIPFNIAHAAGNAALALVAGPALIRMLTRYRERFEFAWSARPGRAARGAAGAACAAAVALLAAGPIDSPRVASAAGGKGPMASASAKGPQAAVAYLRGAQNPDGGFGAAPGEESSPGMTGWAVLGLEAAGVNPRRLSNGGPSAIAYLKASAAEITTTGDIERTILVLSSAGLDPKRFAKRNMLTRLRARRRDDGSWGGQVNPTAFGVLALDAAGQRSGNRRSARWLVSAQNPDGGWGFVPGSTSDSDSTGAVLQALAAAGGSRAAISDGVGWLRGAQGAGGGFALSGGPVNSQSTAWAVQGLLAAGVAPRRLRSGGHSPLDYLGSNQAGDGHFRYSSEYDQTPVWVTGQALQAVAGQAFPLDRISTRAKPTAPKGTTVPDGGAGAVPSAPGTKPRGAGAAGAAGGGETGATEGGKEPPAGSEPASPPVPGPSTQDAPVAPDTSAAPSDDDDGLPLAEIGAAGLMLLVALGGAWLLRRQG